jgi:hypothetical protein
VPTFPGSMARNLPPILGSLVGYIGQVDFGKLHAGFVRMSAAVEVRRPASSSAATVAPGSHSSGDRARATAVDAGQIAVSLFFGPQSKDFATGPASTTSQGDGLGLEGAAHVRPRGRRWTPLSTLLLLLAPAPSSA